MQPYANFWVNPGIVSPPNDIFNHINMCYSHYCVSKSEIFAQSTSKFEPVGEKSRNQEIKNNLVFWYFCRIHYLTVYVSWTYFFCLNLTTNSDFWQSYSHFCILAILDTSNQCMRWYSLHFMLEENSCTTKVTDYPWKRPCTKRCYNSCDVSLAGNRSMKSVVFVNKWCLSLSDLFDYCT